MFSAMLAATVLMMQGAAPAAAASTTPDAAKPPAGNTVSPLTVPSARPNRVDPQQVVCHKEKVLGSMFPKEICATRQAMDERRREDQEQVREWVAVKPLKSN